MLPYERSVGFFESFPVLEVSVWDEGSVLNSDVYDLIDVLPALRKRGDTGAATFTLEGTARGGDTRWMLDYFWDVAGWDAGTTAAARNHSVMSIDITLDAVGPGHEQVVVPFNGPGPVVRYTPTRAFAKSGASGTVRLRGRAFQVSVTHEGTNVPTLFNFGAYLRAV